jgi:hypothetical protein
MQKLLFLGLGADGAVIGLGDEEGTVALGGGDGVLEGLGRGQGGEDLLLIALDALRARQRPSPSAESSGARSTRA